jgi:predicted transcriptional regulator
MITATPRGPLSTMIDIISATENVTLADKSGVNELTEKTIPETHRLQSAHQDACAEVQSLTELKRQLSAQYKQVEAQLRDKEYAALVEATQNPSADVAGLSANLIALEREVRFRKDGIDLLEFVLIPAALERQYEIGRDSARSIHLESALYAAAAQIDALERLQGAGFGEAHGRTVVLSSKVEALKALVSECQRHAAVTSQEFEAFKKQRAERAQQRMLAGATTHAEFLAMKNGELK